MPIYLSHESALRFWRAYDYAHYSDIQRLTRKSLTQAGSSLAEMKRCQPFASLSGRLAGGHLHNPYDVLSLTTPLHVMVDSPDLLKPSGYVTPHLVTAKLPTYAFAQIGPELYVATPELCILQLAAHREYKEVIPVAYEFCSNYALPLNLIGDPIDRPPLCTQQSLLDFANAAQGLHGAKKARVIANNTLDNSRSPAETQMSMVLTLPDKLDGYALPKPVLNHKVLIPADQREFTTRSVIECDLYWPGQRIDLEYISYKHHKEDRQRGFDNNRAVVFGRMGIYHIAVSRWQSDSREEFEIVVRALREKLGLRPRTYTADQELRRLRLRHYLNDRHL